MASAWTLNTSQRLGKFIILALRGPRSGNLYSQCKSFITSTVNPEPLQKGSPTVIRVTDRLAALKVGGYGWIGVLLCICTPFPSLGRDLCTFLATPLLAFSACRAWHLFVIHVSLCPYCQINCPNSPATFCDVFPRYFPSGLITRQWRNWNP